NKRYGNNSVSVRDDSSPFSKPSKPLTDDSFDKKKLITDAKTDKEEIAQKLDTEIPKDLVKNESPNDGISLISPVNGGNVVSRFGVKNNDGINIAINEGEPIFAAASGTVVYAGNDVKDYGNMVIIRHDNDWMTAYAHASKIAIKKNDYVKQGDLIAYIGSTGGVKSSQLHFTLRHGRNPVNPEKFLPAIK
ncbi:MAG: M23 family metallopeptidase, partial [Pseudomonadota bacterium]